MPDVICAPSGRGLFPPHLREEEISRGMRWRVSVLAVEGLLAGATGWACHPLPVARSWSHPRRPAAAIPSRGQHQGQKKLPQQRVEFKAIRRRRAPPTTMTAAADGGSGGGCTGGGDGPSKEYNRDAWQRRASRAMKYVSMPIVKKAGQPREQVCVFCARTMNVPTIEGARLCSIHRKQASRREEWPRKATLPRLPSARGGRERLSLPCKVVEPSFAEY